MWINNNISRPLRHDKYKTLVDVDGLGNLEEYSNELFDGYNWCNYGSNAQFICYWWAEKENYKIIIDKIEAEITRIDVGSYQLDNIKVGETYTISQSGTEEPKIEKNV